MPCVTRSLWQLLLATCVPNGRLQVTGQVCVHWTRRKRASVLPARMPLLTAVLGWPFRWGWAAAQDRGWAAAHDWLLQQLQLS